jgi:hypothetical protein
MARRHGALASSSNIGNGVAASKTRRRGGKWRLAAAALKAAASATLIAKNIGGVAAASKENDVFGETQQHLARENISGGVSGYRSGGVAWRKRESMCVTMQ